MKRKIILSITFVLSLTILLLTSSDSTAQSPNQFRVIADTGVVSLGPNQILRITASEGIMTAKFSLFDSDELITRRKPAAAACANSPSQRKAQLIR